MVTNPSCLHLIILVPTTSASGLPSGSTCASCYLILGVKHAPIFEFVCADCGKPFEERVLSTSRMDEVTCPACHSQNITKKISTFASRLSSGDSFSFSSASSSGCTGAGSV